MSVNSLRSFRCALLVAALLSGFPSAFAQQTTPPNVITGVGTANVNTAIASFRTAIGGVDNGGNPPGKTSGRREINWDGVKLDGTDFNGNSTVIVPGKTVGIPANRFQARGVLFDEVYAVSGDGFASANPAIAGQFPAFSPSNTFAPFTGNTLDMGFVVPSAPTSAPAPAVVSGFGAVFIDVDFPNTTSIEYFNNSTSLGKFFVPAGPSTQPEFLGVLFPSNTVTRVTITLGNAQIFSFGGASLSPTPVVEGLDMVVTDDFIYPEPIASFQPVDVAIGADNQTRILYGTPDGRAAIQVVDNTGKVTGQSTYGPFPGASPMAIAIGADGITRLLWQNSGNGSNTATVFGLDANGNFLGQLNIPSVSGFSFQDIAVGSNNQNIILLVSTDGTTAQVWSTDNLQKTLNQTTYGPFPGATAIALAAGSDGITRLLWQDNGVGANDAVVFGLDANGNFLGQINLPSVNGFSYRDISVAPDNTNRVLLSSLDGTSFALWTVTNAGAISNQNVFGPFNGVTASAVETGPDGLARVLAPSSLVVPTATGQTGIALINPNGTMQNNFSLGAF